MGMLLTKHFESTLNQKPYQTVVGIKLKDLYICKEVRPFHDPEVHYVYKEDLIDQLRQAKHEVKEFEIELPIDEALFNELHFTHYQDCRYYDLFLFENFAIMIDEMSIEVFAQTGITLSDAINHWEIEIPEGEFEVVEAYCVPRDRVSDLAKKLENHLYCYWDMTLRCPGEYIEVENRLSDIQEYYTDLMAGECFDSLLNDVIRNLQDWAENFSGIPENKEKQDYYTKCYQEANSLIAKTNVLKEEIIKIVNSLSDEEKMKRKEIL